MSVEALSKWRLSTSRCLLIAVSVGFYVVLCAMLWHGIRIADGGHFFYSLDDPYIHLALSEQIAKGHYGINVGEAASPSSSMLWPLLLAPFARYSWQPIVPLLLNFLSGLAAATLFGLAVALWPGSWQTGEEWLRRALSAMALVLIGNLVGLTFIGMEHTLQVLLAAACTWGIIAALRGQRIPAWCLVAAAIGPMVRYESVGLVLALAIALIGQHRHRAAAVLAAVSMAPLIAFSVFLHHLGLPWLPTSVLVKADVVGLHNGLGHRALAMSENLFVMCIEEPHHILLLVLFLTLAGLAWKEPVRVRRFALIGAATAAGLHLVIGKFNWFDRYEVYIVLFSAMIVLYVLHERPRMLLGWYALGLLGCSALYIQAVRDTVKSSQSVYLQQHQTQRFVTEFYKGNVAVNDLGLVSYRRRPGTDVLDLFGLASLESARQKDKSAAWLDAITQEHHVGLVVVYSTWFKDMPANWTRLGELCLIAQPVALGGNCVSYYETPVATAEPLREEFETFVKTLPAGIRVTMNPR